MTSFASLSAWGWLIQFFIIVVALLVANLVRCNVPLFKRSLLPSALLAGLLILCLKPFGFFAALVDKPSMEIITYHALGLGFVAMALKNKKIRSATTTMKVVETGAVTASTYILQGLTGLLITIPLFLLWNNTDFFYASGVLLPMGYGQGPGQAFNWGTNYQNGYGFTNGSSFGLTIAAMGFVSASVGGILYLNRPALKNRLRKDGEEIRDDLKAEDYCGDNEIPVSESMDKLTIQFGLVFLTYAVAFLSMWLLYRFVLEPAGGFAMNTINPLIWGFNFLVGTAWAILFKNIGNRLRAKGIMHREYTNNFMLNRISGLMFDIMVVASIASIDLSAFRYKEFWVPLLLVCIAGALVTYWYCSKVCKHLFPGYSDEMFLVMFGMLTGTASTGVILLREIDPLFKTPASHNLIYQNLWSIVLGAPMLLMMGFVPRSMTHQFVCMGIIVVLFGIMLLLQYRDVLFKKKKAEE
jgi:ESS family glutamate:Na+ symporter